MTLADTVCARKEKVMLQTTIYKKTRKALAHYMDLIRDTYYDDTIKYETRFEMIGSWYEQAKAVLFFSFTLNCMNDDMYDDMYQRMRNYYMHYRKLILAKKW